MKYDRIYGSNKKNVNVTGTSHFSIRVHIISLNFDFYHVILLLIRACPIYNKTCLIRLGMLTLFSVVTVILNSLSYFTYPKLKHSCTKY